MASTRARRWCATLNNPTPDELEKFRVGGGQYVESQFLKYFIVGLEKGESGTPHLQMYAVFNVSTRFSAVKRFFGERAHIEKAKGTTGQNKAYCTKEGDYNIWGVEVEQGARTDLAAVRALVDGGAGAFEVREHMSYATWLRLERALKKDINDVRARGIPRWREVEVINYWGETGKGKSRRASEEAPDAYWCPPVTTGGQQWWDNYEGQATIIMDEFGGELPIQTLLRVLDGHPLQLQVKGSHVQAGYTKVYITSNRPIEAFYPMAHGNHLAALARRITSSIEVK